MICHKSDSDSIEKTVSALKKGEIVIIPTDTVYGFSGLADSVNSCDQKIRKIKGRAESKPFIQLISSAQKLSEYTDDKLPSSLLNFWPGALTIIVKDKRFSTKDCIVKTAFRCPGDEWLRTVLAKLDVPIYSTSVNRSGFPVLDEEKALICEFEKEVSLVVADGDKKNALPSTIVEFEANKLKILRQGAVKIPENLF